MLPVLRNLMVYVGITHWCITRLQSIVFQNVQDMEEDGGPHWSCVREVTLDLRLEIRRLRRHFAVKGDYVENERFGDFVKVCEEIAKIISKLEHILSERFFNRFVITADILKYYIIRRYVPKGCTEIPSGAMAIRNLKSIDQQLATLRSRLEGMVPDIEARPRNRTNDTEKHEEATG